MALDPNQLATTMASADIASLVPRTMDTPRQLAVRLATFADEAGYNGGIHIMAENGPSALMQRTGYLAVHTFENRSLISVVESPGSYPGIVPIYGYRHAPSTIYPESFVISPAVKADRAVLDALPVQDDVTRSSPRVLSRPTIGLLEHQIPPEITEEDKRLDYLQSHNLPVDDPAAMDELLLRQHIDGLVLDSRLDGNGELRRGDNVEWTEWWHKVLEAGLVHQVELHIPVPPDPIEAIAGAIHHGKFRSAAETGAMLDTIATHWRPPYEGAQLRVVTRVPARPFNERSLLSRDVRTAYMAAHHRIITDTVRDKLTGTEELPSKA